ncbi:MAG TPA: KH domain-containing protein [Candidatus Dormibacteraeota bacterium]|nr:KH domain-containing protein [Candidatus Dormibacteraeota bacterium]
MTDYADLTLYIARMIADDKEAVSVRVKPGGRQTVIEVKCSAPDMGKLIGKNGRNIDAIRTVVRAAAAKDGQEVDVDFVD